jgi:VWFA-related protein
MLVLCTQQVKVITPFTNDRKAIHDGIDSIKKVVGAGQNRASSLDQLKGRINQFIDAGKEPKFAAPTLSFSEYYSMSTTLVDAFVDEEILSSRNTLAALGGTAAALAGLEGKNVIIFAGAHMPENPGRETYQWLYNVFSPFISSLTMSSEFLNGRAGSMQRYSIEEAAKQASANNVALYMIDAADSRDSISAENSEAMDKTEQFASFTNTATAYQTLARISGGLALTNSDNFDSAFDTLANDLNSYYSLGFKPAVSATGAPRNIVVKMKNPEYRFRSRETYIAKAPSTEDEMGNRVIANLYNADPHSTWPVDLRAGAPEKEGDQYKVPFELSFSPTIALLPKESDLVGSFTVYVVVGSDGKTSTLIKKPYPVKVPSDAEDDFRTKPMTYKAAILMTSGENTLSVGIVDQNSNISGFAHVKVVVP